MKFDRTAKYLFFGWALIFGIVILLGGVLAESSEEAITTGRYLAWMICFFGISFVIKGLIERRAKKKAHLKTAI